MRKQKLVPVDINGVIISVYPASIDKSNRAVLHGEYKGARVNSPAICEIGESVILWPDADKPLAISMRKAAAGVFATTLLRTDGFTVTPTA